MNGMETNRIMKLELLNSNKFTEYKTVKQSYTND